jgi:hypothetical protein
MEEFATAFAQNADLSELRLIEALLFLSMCALHQDAPTRQAAMFAIGLRLLNEHLPLT